MPLSIALLYRSAMTLRTFAAGCIVLIASVALAQATSKPLEFEVASVRQAVPADSQAGSGRRGTTGAGAVSITSDRASYRDITLKSLLMRAYDLGQFQVSGPPWLAGERSDIL